MERAQPAAVRYTFALGSVAIAFFVRMACDHLLGDRSALDFFLAATAVSAWYGGAGPAILSIVLSTLVGQWFFVPPRHTLIFSDVVDLVETASFIFSGSAIAWLSCAMKRATGRALKELEERRRVEGELQALNGRLEERVDQRTVELRHALHELEAYAHSIAHNLRAPLRGMSGMAELVREQELGRLSDDGRQNLDRIVEASRRMDELILGLLEYSRASREEFSPARVPLADAVREAVRQRREEIASKGASIEVHEPLPDILGHRESVVQVLSQLISNAVKFVAPNVTPSVHLRAEQLGPRVRVWVEDNGIGIDAQYHDRVFGVFERLHRQEDYPGTGIGLAIVRRCMERMGGRAAVDSEPGKGSRFWIEAPAAPVPASAGEPVLVSAWKKQTV